MAHRRNATTVTPVITGAQIKMVHALKSALNITDKAHWHEVLYTRFGVISSKELNMEQAGKLIDEMRTLAVDNGVWEQRENKRQRFNNLADRPAMASPEQLCKIEAQWQDVSRVTPEEQGKALRHFITRIAKVSDLRFLDQDGAGKVLNALKAMHNRSEGAQKAKTNKKGV